MIDDIIKDAERKMGYTVDHTREEFAAIRTGRAHPAMFSKIMVDYYGSPTPLQQLPPSGARARTVLISPFDRGSVKPSKAIRDSDLGVNPAAHGSVIRLVMPQRPSVAAVHRRRQAEDGRIACSRRRHPRRHQSGEGPGIAGRHKGADKARCDHQKYIDQIDAELKAKEAELLESDGRRRPHHRTDEALGGSRPARSHRELGVGLIALSSSRWRSSTGVHPAGRGHVEPGRLGAVPGFGRLKARAASGRSSSAQSR